jgi:hypothetical protein
MVRSRFLALLLVPLAFMLMGGATPIPLTEPAPLAVPAGLKAEQVSRAIKLGVTSRTGWTVTKEQGNQIEATLSVRQHILKVIHPKWVNWTRNLMSDIQRELQLLTVK